MPWALLWQHTFSPFHRTSFPNEQGRNGPQSQLTLMQLAALHIHRRKKLRLQVFALGIILAMLTNRFTPHLAKLVWSIGNTTIMQQLLTGCYGTQSCSASRHSPTARQDINAVDPSIGGWCYILEDTRTQIQSQEARRWQTVSQETFERTSHNQTIIHVFNPCLYSWLAAFKCTAHESCCLHHPNLTRPVSSNKPCRWGPELAVPV